MTIALSPSFGAGWQFFADDGQPLAGGYLYTYRAGTTTPAYTYTSNTGTVANSNPIVLDAGGRVPEEVWVTVGSSYKYVLKDSVGNTIWTKDNVAIYTPPDPLVSLEDSVDKTLGDALVAFRQSNASGNLSGAMAGTVHTKLQEMVSVKDFGAKGDGSTDDHGAIVAAVATGRKVHFPAGVYLLKSKLEFAGLSNFELVGDGIGASTLRMDNAAVGPMMHFEACANWRIAHLTIDPDNSSALSAAADPVALYIYNCTAPSIEECEFINHPVIGVYMINTGQFQICNNRFYFPTPRGDITNYNVNLGFNDDANNGYNRNGVISGNYSYGSQFCVYGKDISIINNVFTESRYGAGLATGAGNINDFAGWADYGPYSVVGNLAYLNVGYDKDNTDVCGMEINGYNSLVANNVVSQNGGAGIRLYGRSCCVTGNWCAGNGTNVQGLHSAIPDSERCGISSYEWSGYGSSYSLIANNKCSDIGADTQLYGYYERTDEVFQMTVVGNDFKLNYNDGAYIQAASGNYDIAQWMSWTPTLTAGSGSITAATVNHAKYRLAGKHLFFQIKITVTTKGTSGAALIFTLPTRVRRCDVSISGYGVHSNNKLLGVNVSDTGYGYVYLYDGSTPFLNDGDVIRVSGFYETP